MSVGPPVNVGHTLTALGFWIGALLPVAYVPVLLVGLDSPNRLLAFVGLVAINVVALVIGHDYPER